MNLSSKVNKLQMGVWLETQGSLHCKTSLTSPEYLALLSLTIILNSLMMVFMNSLSQPKFSMDCI